MSLHIYADINHIILIKSQVDACPYSIIWRACSCWCAKPRYCQSPSQCTPNLVGADYFGPVDRIGYWFIYDPSVNWCARLFPVTNMRLLTEVMLHAHFAPQLFIVGLYNTFYITQHRFKDLPYVLYRHSCTTNISTTILPCILSHSSVPRTQTPLSLAPLDRLLFSRLISTRLCTIR